MASLGGRGRVGGTLAVPGDKSISHRSLLLSALATGESRVRGLLLSDDVRSTAAVLRTMGWEVPEVGPSMDVRGRGLRSERTGATAPLNCGNSGTTARLVAGIAAAQPIAVTLIGDASLSRRPMKRLAGPLEAMGAQVDFLRDHDGLPMRIRGGALRTIAWELPVASAQLKSAILLAGLCAGVGVRVREPSPSRDHTERMLTASGAEVRRDGDWVELVPAATLAPLDIDVPGDPSSAAFFAVLAALADEGELTITGVSLNPLRVGFLSVLQRMGVRCSVVERGSPGGEPVGDIVVSAGVGEGTEIVAEEVPSLIDEIPILAVLAARATGETTVRGAAELRVKESDRIATMVANLRAVGVDAEELPDGLVVRGSRAPLRGRVVTGGDHRIAMAFAVLGVASGGEIVVDDPRCVAVSYPRFWDDLADVVG